MSSTQGTGDETSGLRERVRARLVERGAGPGVAILVACSGGPDSTAMLDALSSVAADLAIRLLCAYFDHGIRPVAERLSERAAVEALASRLGVAFVGGEAAPGALQEQASMRGASLEQVARDARYGFLERTAKELGASLIAVGHTADDVAETVLMRVLQGVDVSGLGGIPESRGMVVRPLYDVTRAEVMRYLEERGLDYVSDSTNADPRWLRNRVRSELMPVLGLVFPSYRQSLRELARKARATGDFIRRAAARIAWERSGEGLRAPWSTFHSAEGVLRLAAAFAAFDRLGSGRVSYRLLEPLVRPLDPAKQGVIVAGGGWKLSRRGPWVHAEPDVVRGRKIGYLVHVRTPGDYAIPECGIAVRVARPVSDGSLVIRSPRPGDRVRSRGRWMTVERLAAGCGGTRDLLPIVADRRGVVRVLGSAVGCTDTVADRDDGETSGAADISVAVRVEEQ